MNADPEIFYRLGVALAIGLLIGIERGWKEREAEEGHRIAGVRTYGLIGLLGGVMLMLTVAAGPWLLGLSFIGVAGLLAVAHAIHVRGEDDMGITSLIAGLLAFALGALAAAGEVALAAAAAVVTTLLLSYKPLLHQWVSALEGRELQAGLQLLLITIVLLPVLPNQGYGPWQALNPHTIWWMVVLIATISFAGYFATKIGGMERGAVFTGLFGGLASSTAVTLHFSRAAGRHPEMAPMLSVGILLACGTMFPRMLVVASLLNRDLFQPLLIPVVAMTAVVYGPALAYWRTQPDRATKMTSPLKNPLELKSAIGFGLLLAVILLLGKALQALFGETGLLALAAASGITDVDAITLSLARMSGEGVGLNIAVTGIVIAAAVNGLAKATMAAVIAGGQAGWRVGLPLVASAVVGLGAVWLWVW